MYTHDYNGFHQQLAPSQTHDTPQLETKIYHNQITTAKAFFSECSLLLSLPHSSSGGRSHLLKSFFVTHSHKYAHTFCSPLALTNASECMPVRLRSASVIVNFSPYSHRSRENFLISVCFSANTYQRPNDICAIKFFGTKAANGFVCVCVEKNNNLKPIVISLQSVIK